MVPVPSQHNPRYFTVPLLAAQQRQPQPQQQPLPFGREREPQSRTRCEREHKQLQQLPQHRPRSEGEVMAKMVRRQPLHPLPTNASASALSLPQHQQQQHMEALVAAREAFSRLFPHKGKSDQRCPPAAPSSLCAARLRSVRPPPGPAPVLSSSATSSAPPLPDSRARMLRAFSAQPPSSDTGRAAPSRAARGCSVRVRAISATQRRQSTVKRQRDRATVVRSPPDWRSYVSIEERQQVRAQIREAFTQECRTLEEVIELTSMVSEELLLRSSFQRIDYLKDGVQWRERLRVKKNEAARGRSHSHRTTSSSSSASGSSGVGGNSSPVSGNSKLTTASDLDRQSSAQTEPETPTAASTSAAQDADSAKMDTSDDADGTGSSTSTDAKSAASDQSGQSPDSDEKKLFDPSATPSAASGEASGEPNSKRRKCI